MTVSASLQKGLLLVATARMVGGFWLAVFGSWLWVVVGKPLGC